MQQVGFITRNELTRKWRPYSFNPTVAAFEKKINLNVLKSQHLRVAHRLTPWNENIHPDERVLGRNLLEGYSLASY
jgi:hypothetical protein